MEKDPKEYRLDLFTVLDWMFKDGTPDPAINMDADTMILMDIAIHVRRLVALSEESMRINQLLMSQLDHDGDTTEH